MKQAAGWKDRIFFLLGLICLLLGMLIEFLLGLILPSLLMQMFYFHGVFLCLFIFFFCSGLYLIRRGIFGWWRARSDSIVFSVAAILCATITLQTLLNLQSGHPYQYLADINPILMILLWAFILPPLNPVTTTILVTIFMIFAILNVYLMPKYSDVLNEESVQVHQKFQASWWQILVDLTRMNVWLGSIFLLTLAFIILGSPPLSFSPVLPLYDPLVWLRFFTALASACLLNSFIFIQNQLGDLDTDRLHREKTHLPLAVGRISPKTGFWLALGFLALAIILALIVSITFFLVLLVIVLLGFLYSAPPFRLKGKPIIDLVLIGLAFGTMAIIAAWVILAVQPMLPALLLIGPGLFYAGTHGVHTASDYAADKQANLKTTAVFLGPFRATRLGLILIAVGLIILYSTVGFYTHLFWYGLLKFKTIFLFTFCGFPFFVLIETYRQTTSKNKNNDTPIDQLRKRGRLATYLLFLILLIYCLFHVFIFYPTYYPSYDFPWFAINRSGNCN